MSSALPIPSLPPDPRHSSAPETSSNLYLYPYYFSIPFIFSLQFPFFLSITFLATLFVLLVVSCGIVLRSYILRRRYQQRLEEALGSGLLLAPRAQGSKRKRLGTKPKIISTWLAEGGEKWNQMTVSLSQLSSIFLFISSLLISLKLMIFITTLASLCPACLCQA